MLIWLDCSGKSVESYYTTFDISRPWYFWSDQCASSAGWMSVSGPFCRGFVNLRFFLVLGKRHQNQISYDGSWNWGEMCWILFSLTELCNKEWECMYEWCVRVVESSHSYSVEGKKRISQIDIGRFTTATLLSSGVHQSTPNRWKRGFHFKYHVSRLRFGGILLWFEWIIRPNWAVLSFFTVTFYRSGGLKLPIWDSIGIIGGQPPHRHSISAWIYHEKAQWWCVSRVYWTDWCFGEYRNVS